MEDIHKTAEIVVQKSDSGLRVALHPLVLLTISDYITRHTLRQYDTPVVGALLGQQNGRETTIEHAFECKADGPYGTLDGGWFATRLQQMRDVHKAPALDLVGWYTLMPVDGPKQHHIPVQTQLLSFYPECTLLLGFHPSNVLEGSVGGKLPLTIYETSLEPLKAGAREDVDMNTDQPEIKVVYKEVPYTVETEDSEMIGIDFVARGGGNATASSKPKTTPVEAAGKGKKRAAKTDPDTKATEEAYIISREDEELIAALTAKANAIKMLQARISLLTTYLTSLPPGYVSGLPYNASEASDLGHSPVNHSILRSIRALLIRLSLLIPADSSAFNRELLSEQNDVNLVNLLSTLTQNIKGARETGRKFMVVESARSSGSKKEMGGVSGARMMDMERIINESRSHVDKSRDHLGAGDLMG